MFCFVTTLFATACIYLFVTLSKLLYILCRFEVVFHLMVASALLLGTKLTVEFNVVEEVLISGILGL